MKGTLGIPAIRPGGKLGNVVFIRSADGYVVRERVTPANPRTALQTATRREFAIASQGWKGLSDEAFAAWQAFGVSSGRAAYNVHMGLTRKWLAVHNGGTPPTMPPTGPFFGDAVQLQVTPSSSGSSWRGGRGERLEQEEAPACVPPSPAPSSMTNHIEEGVLTLVSDRPNSPGVVTEILVQRIPHARRKPKARDWKTAGYFAFGSAPVAIPLAPGAYAVAYRFVNSATGQATAMAELGSVELGAENV